MALVTLTKNVSSKLFKMFFLLHSTSSPRRRLRGQLPSVFLCIPRVRLGPSDVFGGFVQVNLEQEAHHQQNAQNAQNAWRMLEDSCFVIFFPKRMWDSEKLRDVFGHNFAKT